MYKTYYSLSRNPFPKDIRTKEAYASSTHREVIARLNYLKKTRGIGMVIGEPGVGKTFSLRTFADSLNPALYHVVYFPLSTGGVMDFYRGLAYGLGEQPRFRKVDVFQQIQQGIQRMYKERSVTPVLILDELHMAKDAFLSDLSLLFNFGMDSETPYILILTGLPHLRARLGLNPHRPLAQRIIMNYELEPMNHEETAAYVRYQLELAGAKVPIFTESALEAIALRSQGLPRLINKLATTCLLIGFQQSKELVDEEIVRLSVEENYL